MAKKKIAYLVEKGAGNSRGIVAAITVCNQRLSRPRQAIDGKCRTVSQLPNPQYNCLCREASVYTHIPSGGVVIDGITDIDRYRILGGGGGGGGYFYEWEPTGGVLGGGDAEVEFLDSQYYLVLKNSSGDDVVVREGNHPDLYVPIEVLCGGGDGPPGGFSLVSTLHNAVLLNETIQSTHLFNGNFDYNLTPEYLLPQDLSGGEATLHWGYVDISSANGTQTGITISVTINGVTHDWTGLTARIPTCLIPRLEGNEVGGYISPLAASYMNYDNINDETTLGFNITTSMCGSNPSGHIDSCCLFLPSQGGCFSPSSNTPLPITINEATGYIEFVIPTQLFGVLNSSALVIHMDQPTNCVFGWFFDLMTFSPS